MKRIIVNSEKWLSSFSFFNFAASEEMKSLFLPGANSKAQYSGLEGKESL